MGGARRPRPDGAVEDDGPEGPRRDGIRWGSEGDLVPSGGLSSPVPRLRSIRQPPGSPGRQRPSRSCQRPSRPYRDTDTERPSRHAKTDPPSPVAMNRAPAAVQRARTDGRGNPNGLPFPVCATAHRGPTAVTREALLLVLLPWWGTFTTVAARSRPSCNSVRSTGPSASPVSRRDCSPREIRATMERSFRPMSAHPRRARQPGRGWRSSTDTPPPTDGKGTPDSTATTCAPRALAWAARECSGEPTGGVVGSQRVPTATPSSTAAAPP